MPHPKIKLAQIKGRWGRIRRRILWPHLGPDEMPELKFLTPAAARDFVAAIQSGAIGDRPPDEANVHDPPFITGLTAQRYLELCAICIRAISEEEARDRAKARDVYRRWSDGRHGGLLDLPPRNARAFREWLVGNQYAGSHPFEFVRDRHELIVNHRGGRQCWLWLLHRRRVVSFAGILMANALHMAGAPVYVEAAEQHAVYAVGDDYVGVADDHVWNEGSPVWPKDAGILTRAESFLVSQLAPFPGLLDQVEWFPTTKVAVEKQ